MPKYIKKELVTEGLIMAKLRTICYFQLTSFTLSVSVVVLIVCPQLLSVCFTVEQIRRVFGDN